MADRPAKVAWPAISRDGHTVSHLRPSWTCATRDALTRGHGPVLGRHARARLVSHAPQQVRTIQTELVRGAQRPGLLRRGGAGRGGSCHPPHALSSDQASHGNSTNKSTTVNPRQHAAHLFIYMTTFFSSSQETISPAWPWGGRSPHTAATTQAGGNNSYLHKT